MRPEMTDQTGHGIRFGRIAATVPVSDMERALAFYFDMLGFRSVFLNGTPMGVVILRRDDAELHLTLHRDHKGGPSNVAHLMVADIDAFHDLCQRHGVRIVKGLEDEVFGLRAFVLADPDGSRIDVG